MERKKMNKRIISLSILTAVFILLAGYTPALASPENNLLAMKNDLVTIEVNHYLGRQTKQIRTTVTAGNAEEIRHHLIELYKAQERNDHGAIVKYETLLNEKGIFGESYQQLILKNNGNLLFGKSNLLHSFTSLANENISNRLCYFNAIGEGLVAWWLALLVLQGIIRLIQNTSSAIVALILLLVFLPYFVLTMLITNLIPFRILAPAGALSLKNGTISCLGLNGFQRLKVSSEGYGVNHSGFTGITINIPPINNRSSFLFISGFALKAEGTPI